MCCFSDVSVVKQDIEPRDHTGPLTKFLTPQSSRRLLNQQNKPRIMISEDSLILMKKYKIYLFSRPIMITTVKTEIT